MKFFILSWIILFAGWPAVVSAQGNLGQSGANFLQIGVEPRGTALGGAGVAMTRGAQALFWNPAGAVSTNNYDLNFSYTNWFVDTKLAYGALVKNFKGIGAFGLSITSFYMDDMEITTVFESEGTGEFYSAGDIALGLSYARSLTDRFTFGVTAKYVREDIWNETADNIAVDVGSRYRTDFMNLRIGMAIRNVSGRLKFSGENIDKRIEEELAQNQPDNPRTERLTPEFRLPQNFQIGIAFDPLTTENSRLTLISDVESPNDNDERIVFAAEYGFQEFAFLRGAYRVNYDVGELSFGAGLNLNVSGLVSRIDYSFSAYDFLGDVHRFGFGFSF